MLVAVFCVIPDRAITRPPAMQTDAEEASQPNISNPPPHFPKARAASEATHQEETFRRGRLDAGEPVIEVDPPAVCDLPISRPIAKPARFTGRRVYPLRGACPASAVPSAASIHRRLPRQRRFGVRALFSAWPQDVLRGETTPPAAIPVAVRRRSPSGGRIGWTFQNDPLRSRPTNYHLQGR